MQDNKDKRPCKKLKVNFTYKKPTDYELRNLIDSSRCKNTDYSTSNWIRALEKFRTDVNYQGLIEEVDTKEELEDQLCRFVHAMRKKDGSEYHVSSVNSCIEVEFNGQCNHSGRKTLVQILKRRGFSNSECMASTRHKSEQGLARYERPETEIQ
ncbi:unnamed protein product [Rhizophagus irregularis]|nr:unnamed protein product [Rhizophagus irregularis]